MDEPASGEFGFALIEVIVAAGLVALALSFTLGAVLTLARLPSERSNRALALRVAQNLLVRARAAGAYYPRPADPLATLPPQYADPSNLPLAPSSSYALDVERPIPQPAGTPSPQMVHLQVRTTFVPDARADGFAGTFSVRVDYPNAGENRAGSIELSTDLAAPSFTPGTRVGTSIQEPMRQ